MLFLAYSCFPAPAWVVSGPQSLWGCLCSSVSPLWPTVPQRHLSSIRSSSFKKCIYSHVHNNVIFLTAPFSPKTLFLILSHRSPFTHPPVSSLTNIFSVPPVLSLCHLKTCLERGTMPSSDWLKV